VNIGVGRESRSSISSRTGIVNGTLLVCDVAHGRGWVVGMGVKGEELWEEERKGAGALTAHPIQVL